MIMVQQIEIFTDTSSTDLGGSPPTVIGWTHTIEQEATATHHLISTQACHNLD